MELIHYLNDNFYRLEELLTKAGITESVLRQYQTFELMPKASYALVLDLKCDSFLGLHSSLIRYEYYPKTYVAWLKNVLLVEDKNALYAEFSHRYITTLESLKLQGYTSGEVKMNAGLSEHIKMEWQHFVNGVYGLCTKSGLPEDIAAKELAISQIEELTAKETQCIKDTEKLTRAVDLLDNASSFFAPHERSKSSRYRYIDSILDKERTPSPN